MRFFARRYKGDHICQAVQQAALAWPGVRFRLTHNGQDVADYPAASSRRDRMLQVYGMRFMEHAAPVSGERAGVRVEGVTIQPMHTRAGRNPQESFVNRRAVKNAAVAHAVYDAYGAYLAKGQHPQFVLFLDVDSERAVALPPQTVMVKDSNGIPHPVRLRFSWMSPSFGSIDKSRKAAPKPHDEHRHGKVGAVVFRDASPRPPAKENRRGL